MKQRTPFPIEDPKPVSTSPDPIAVGAGGGSSQGWKPAPGIRAAIVLAGILLGQIVLYGPSLFGKTVLLPLDLLAQPSWYLPRTAATQGIVPHNVVLSDPVLQYELKRRFAVSEIRAGRWPLWSPYNYTGSPTVDSFSPFQLISLLSSAPILLAWAQLLKSLVAGIGAYLFFRRALDVGFQPAAIGAICYPITGFFVLWQGYPLSSVAAWLPWTLLAVDRTVRKPAGWGGPALAVSTGAALSTGKIDIAGLVLLTSGVYALWCLIDECGWPPGLQTAPRALAAVAGAWVLGFLLATPYLLPLGEYVMTGFRAAERARGVEERPPVGLSALPQTVLPDLYGSWQKDSFRIVPGNRLESTAAAYAGFVATLLLAPLAFCSRRHRSQNALWLILGFLGLGWALNVPGLVQLLRAPGLNMISFNRSVFVTSFAVLSLAVVGLDWLERGTLGRRLWFRSVMLLVALIAAFSLYRSSHLPEPVASLVARALEEGRPVFRIPDAAALERVRQTFVDSYRKSLALCALTGIAWSMLWFGLKRQPWTVPLLGAVLLGDLLWFAYGLAPQCDPDLYYPEVEVLGQLADAPPGRVLGIDCLPPRLSQRFGLPDIRGFDGIEPQRLVELLAVVKHPATPTPSYGLTMWFRPRYIDFQPDGARVPPILDMLGVRYLIGRGSPPEGYTPRMSGEDYWVAENERALPRVFVPRRARQVASKAERLRLLAADDFDPGAIAYVEAAVSLPPDCRGTARIVDEIPTRVTVALDMETPGLVVLSDLWFPGWKARIDEAPAAILRTNHAVRGVVAPAGRSRLVFSYEPTSFALGIRLMLTALAGLLVWAVRIHRARRSAI